MNFICCTLAILVIVSSVNCLYIQDAREMPWLQALTRTGKSPAAAVPEPKTVIVVGNSGTPASQMSQNRMYTYPSNMPYGNNMGRESIVLINVAEEQDYARVPFRTVRM